MRIQGVTGDLPAVAQLMSEMPVKVDPPGEAATPPAVAATTAAGDANGDHTSSDHRRPPQPLPSFDPPLIAQRAVLGLPVGPMIAAAAQAEGKSYGEVWAAVDRIMPEDAQGGSAA